MGGTSASDCESESVACAGACQVSFGNFGRGWPDSIKEFHEISIRLVNTGEFYPPFKEEKRAASVLMCANY